MRKFTKSLMALALFFVGVNAADAKVQIEGGIGNLVIPQTYENIGAWSGTWSGNAKENEQDWSAYEYVWIKYSGFSGAINFGVMYSEFESHQSWGDAFVQSTVPLGAAEGIVGIKLDNTTTYIKGNAEEDGEYIGDVYAQHIREVFIQATSGGSSVTLEEMWVGSEDEYLQAAQEAAGWDPSKNHMLLATNGDAKSNPWDYQADYVLPAALEAGKKYVFTADIKAVNGGDTRLTVNGGQSLWLATKGLWADEFTRYEITFTANEGNNKLEIDLGTCGGEVYLDNLVLMEEDGVMNLIENGDFEEFGIAGWTGAGNTVQQVEYELGEVKNPGILITVGEAGWRTFRTGSNVKITDINVRAYATKYNAKRNTVKLIEVYEIPMWAPVLIEAPKGSYMVEIIESVSEEFPADNDLKANGGTDLEADGTLYALGSKDGEVGFYQLSDKVPAWAIYMKIEPEADAPDFLGFEFGESTSISEMNVVKNIAEGEYYNLAGQRVAQPTKGLYIVNGKKVIK